MSALTTYSAMSGSFRWYGAGEGACPAALDAVAPLDDGGGGLLTGRTGHSSSFFARRSRRASASSDSVHVAFSSSFRASSTRRNHSSRDAWYAASSSGVNQALSSRLMTAGPDDAACAPGAWP